MIGKGMGVLALAAVLGFVSYYETSLLQSHQQAAAAPAIAGVLAVIPIAPLQKTVPTSMPPDYSGYNKADADKMCLRSDATQCYFTSEKTDYVCDDPRKSKCDAATAAPPGTQQTTMLPQSSQIAAATVAQPQCVSPEKRKKNLTKIKCYAVSTDGKNTPISEGHCIAYFDCRAEKVLNRNTGQMEVPKVQLASKDGVILVSNTTGAPTGAQNQAPPVVPTSATNPAPPQATAAATVPASRDNFSPAYQNPTDTSGQRTSSSFDANREIQRYGGSGSTGSTGSTGSGGGLTGQTQPSGSAFEQGGFYRAGGTNPSGNLAGSNPSSYYTPGYYGAGLRGQNTFGGTGFSGSRSSGRVASSFISGFASLIGGLFSVPTNSVVNYVQSFVGGSPQQTPANENGGQQQTYAPGQIIVVVPYPMPTSRTTVGGQPTQLPPRPTSTTDAYAELREMARQAGEIPGATVSTGAQEDRVTAAFSGQEGETRPGASPAGNQNANGQSGATPAAGTQSGLSRGGLQTGTTSLSGEQATSTHATSTSYKEPKVVEIGTPVDITDLGSYEAVLAYLKGDWARTERTALQNKVALAQAEVQQDAIRAQLEALQDARAANLCDDSCAASLTVLQNELPVLQSRVEALQTAVEKDAQPRPSSPPPTVAQIDRLVESLADPTYEAAIPRSAASEPTAVSVAEQEALPEVPQTKSEAVVTRVVQSIWNFLKSIFLPPTTESAKPRASCSLFASLFGRCK